MSRRGSGPDIAALSLYRSGSGRPSGFRGQTGAPLSQPGTASDYGTLTRNMSEAPGELPTTQAAPHADRAWAATSLALDPSVETIVCIPSFRRPQHLRLTLQSLADQHTDRRFAVVVVENDALKCESVPVAAEFLGSGKLSGLCVVEPHQ